MWQLRAICYLIVSALLLSNALIVCTNIWTCIPYIIKLSISKIYSYDKCEHLIIPLNRTVHWNKEHTTKKYLKFEHSHWIVACNQTEIKENKKKKSNRYPNDLLASYMCMQNLHKWNKQMPDKRNDLSQLKAFSAMYVPNRQIFFTIQGRV